MLKVLLQCHLFLLPVLCCALVMQLCIWFVADLPLIFYSISSCCIILLISLNFVLFEQACYDFACIITTVIDDEIIPLENIIRSIACILGQDDSKEFAVFRYTSFVQLLVVLLKLDSLCALYSSIYFWSTLCSTA